MPAALFLHSCLQCCFRGTQESKDEEIVLAEMQAPLFRYACGVVLQPHRKAALQSWGRTMCVGRNTSTSFEVCLQCFFKRHTETRDKESVMAEMLAPHARYVDRGTITCPKSSQLT
jgi:hypothetical protein